MIRSLRSRWSSFHVVCLPLQVDCHNYIRLLEFLGDGRIYVCGTYAFDPQCAFLVGILFFLCVCRDDAGVDEDLI